MKKMINNSDNIVTDMLDGYVEAFSHLVKRADSNDRVIERTEKKSQDKVGLVIGNGSGHEPIAVGWVGQGLLDANAVGEVFAAPPPDLILDAIRAADHGAGVLLLISAHSGDIMNSEMALELAEEEGINAIGLLMYDDISSAAKENRDERRGAPGTTFLYKILGAMAEEGASLSDLKAYGELVRDRTSTLGAALTSGISPLTGKSMFALPDESVFIGIGVHGEPGLAEIPMDTADNIVSYMMDKIIEDQSFEKNDELLILINGMGATSIMEQLIVYKSVNTYLKNNSLKPFKPLIGSYVTTQDMAGFSISVCRADEKMKRLWDAPFQAPFFYKS